MPVFMLTGPDGSKYRVTAPDGATEQDAINYVQQNNIQPEQKIVPESTGGTASDDQSNQTLAIRHNNPLNIRPTSPDEPQEGGFRTFATPQEGYQEAIRQLKVKLNGTSPAMQKAYGEGYQPTIRNLINVWAPPSDNNDTSSYVNNVVKTTGYDPDQPLTVDDAEKLAQAMIPVEGGPKAKEYFAPGLIDRVQGDLQQRGQNIQNIQQTANLADESVGIPGQIANNLDATGQIASNVLGGVADVGAEGMESLAGLIPQPLKDFAGKAVGKVNDLTGGRLGAYAQGTGDLIQDLDKNFPLLGLPANALNAAGNVQGGQALANFAGSGARAVGDALYNSGKASASKAKTSFLQDLITPKETSKVSNELFSRSKEEGLLRTRVPQPTAQEQNIIKTLEDVPVSKNSSLLKNYNTIKDANRSEADDLIKRLQDSDITIDDGLLASRLENVKTELSSNPYITGDGETAANRVMVGAMEAINANPRTPAGLLQARKDFDKWVSSQKKDTIFNAATDSPVSTAVQRIRQSLNDIVAESVPDAEVKASLAKQSNLYRAMDAIETKGGAEGKNIITRTAQKLGNSIPGKGLGMKAATLTGAGIGLGVSPVITGGALAAYGLGKGLTAPATRTALGSGLRGLGGLTGDLTLSNAGALPVSALLNYGRK